MVIKGGSRRNIGWWTRHLLNDKDNDRVDLAEKRGLVSPGLADMIREMQQAASLSGRCKNFMYVASFNPQAHERLTEPQWERAFEIFEQQRGIFPGTPRVVIEHEKKGRIHRHVIWQRVDLEKGTAFPDGLDRRTCELAAKQIERELGLEHTPKIIDRDRDTPQPAPGPKSWEMYRDKKNGLDTRDITAEVTELRQQSKTGQEFKAALEQHGYELATGKRGLLILDSAGKEHSLARRCGMKAEELNAFMRDVDQEAMPTVEQAKAAYQERKITGLEADRATVAQEIAWEEKLAQAVIDKEKIERQFVEPSNTGGGEKTNSAQEHTVPALADRPGPMQQLHNARQRSDSPKAFMAALAEHGIDLAQATRADAAQSQLDSAEAKIAGYWKPTFREREIVAVTDQGQVWKLTERMTGDKDTQTFLSGLAAPLPSIQETQHRKQREQDLEELKPRGRWATGPPRGGLVEQQAWAMDRVKAADEYRRNEQERRQREEVTKSTGDIDPQRYLTDPDYRRQVRTERAFMTPEERPEERKTEKENNLRALLEQQDRQR